MPHHYRFASFARAGPNSLLHRDAIWIDHRRMIQWYRVETQWLGVGVVKTCDATLPVAAILADAEPKEVGSPEPTLFLPRRSLCAISTAGQRRAPASLGIHAP